MSNKFSLTVGNNAFPSAPLSGCINDARDYHARFVAKGFADTMLFNSGRTQTYAALDAMIDEAIPGNYDKFAFAYSSHGSQVRDISGDESDGWDEVLCPIDWPLYISDDELREIFNKLPADATLDVFLDCCHSGTGTREIDQKGTIRALPPLVGKKSRKAKPKISRAIILVPNLNHCLWAACQAGQTSAELSIGGVVRGAFSYYMCKALASPGGTRTQMIDYVCTKVAALGLSQVPQLEATQSETLQAPFT